MSDDYLSHNFPQHVCSIRRRIEELLARLNQNIQACIPISPGSDEEKDLETLCRYAEQYNEIVESMQSFKDLKDHMMIKFGEYNLLGRSESIILYQRTEQERQERDRRREDLKRFIDEKKVEFKNEADRELAKLSMDIYCYIRSDEVQNNLPKSWKYGDFPCSMFNSTDTIKKETTTATLKRLSAWIERDRGSAIRLCAETILKSYKEKVKQVQRKLKSILCDSDMVELVMRDGLQGDIQLEFSMVGVFLFSDNILLRILLAPLLLVNSLWNLRTPQSQIMSIVSEKTVSIIKYDDIEPRIRQQVEGTLSQMENYFDFMKERTG